MSTHPVTAGCARLLTLVPIADAADPRDPAPVRALVEAAQTGDRDAFGALVEAYERAVYRTVVAALGGPDEADDVAQETFVVAWRKLAGFRHQSSFRTWLVAIAWRKALDRRRRHRLRWSRAATAAPDGVDPIDRLLESGADPERPEPAPLVVEVSQPDAIAIALLELRALDVPPLIVAPIDMGRWSRER